MVAITRYDGKRPILSAVFAIALLAAIAEGTVSAKIHAR